LTFFISIISQSSNSERIKSFSIKQKNKWYFSGYRPIFILFLSSIFFACNHRELKLESIVPCEYSYSDGKCDNSLDTKKDYNIIFTKDSRIDTYSQLSNYLYFKSRFSSGFIIKFNRPPVLPEKEIIKSTYKAYYNFAGIYGQVEGIDMGEDYIYSFVYLGTLLLEKQKEKKEEGKIVPKNTIISFPIEFKFKSELFEGTIKTEQEIKIIRE